MIQWLVMLNKRGIACPDLGEKARILACTPVAIVEGRKDSVRKYVKQRYGATACFIRRPSGPPSGFRVPFVLLDAK